MMRDYILVALLAYFCGSIPFGYILVRIFKKQDIRATGSGNIGATNVARTAPMLGLATLVLDAFKGYFAALFLPTFAFERGMHLRLDVGMALAMLSVVLGHMFPVWLRFRGGKGVATAVGAYLALEPAAVWWAFVVFVLVLIAARYVSLASIAAAIAFPLLAWFLSPWLTTALFGAFVAISALIIVKHHANIRRLLSGTENKLGGKKKLEAVAKED